jgi:hypothetical protein
MAGAKFELRGWKYKALREMSSECEKPVVLGLLWDTQDVSMVGVQDLTGSFR